MTPYSLMTHLHRYNEIDRARRRRKRNAKITGRILTVILAAGVLAVILKG